MLPDRDPVFRRKPHPVAFLDPVGLVELWELLHHGIDAEISRRMGILQKEIVLPFPCDNLLPASGLAFKERPVIGVLLFLFQQAQHALHAAQIRNSLSLHALSRYLQPA